MKRLGPNLIRIFRKAQYEDKNGVLVWKHWHTDHIVTDKVIQKYFS